LPEQNRGYWFPCFLLEKYLLLALIRTAARGSILQVAGGSRPDGRSYKGVFSSRATSCVSALPRWLRACFSSALSSAAVWSSSGTRKCGSYPKPLLPRGVRIILPSQLPCAISGVGSSA